MAIDFFDKALWSEKIAMQWFFGDEGWSCGDGVRQEHIACKPNLGLVGG
jgi:hypothetical protein